MRAYEFPTRITRDGQLKVPDSLVKVLPKDENVRVIVLVNDTNADVGADWARLATEQFFAGYGAADSVYDRV